MWVGCKILARRAAGQATRPLFNAEKLLAFAHEIDRAFEPVAVDDDANAIAVAQFADGAARQGFGANVADAGARRDAREAGVGEESDVLAEAQVLEGGGDLINLLHA